MYDAVFERPRPDFMAGRLPLAFFVITGVSALVTLSVPWLPAVSAAVLGAAFSSGSLGETKRRVTLYVFLLAALLGTSRYFLEVTDFLSFSGEPESWGRMYAADTMSFFGSFFVSAPCAFGICWEEIRESGNGGNQALLGSMAEG